MISSLWIAVSGMSAFNDQISVSSNNISNMETTGFKASSVNFEEILASSITRTTGDNAGCGVAVQSVYETWTQGGITSVDYDSYCAINGYGMFVVSDTSDNALLYTRDGAFTWNDDGKLVYDTDYAVQGYVVNDDGSLGQLTDIDVSYANTAPSATTEMTTTVNLDANAEDGDTFQTTVTVYDSLGNDIALTVTYAKTTTANEWTYTVEIPTEYGSVTSGAPAL